MKERDSLAGAPPPTGHASQASTESRDDRPAWGSLPSAEGPNFYFFLLIAVLCLANFISLPVLSTSRPGLMVIIPATIAAEVGLVAIFGVFSPMAFPTRFVLTVAMGGLLYTGFCLSVLAVSRGDPEAFLILLFGLLISPLIFLAVQAPIWGLRIFYTCQRMNAAENAETGPAENRRSLRLSDILIGTAIVALALALAQLATSVIPAEESGTEVLIAVVLTAAVAMIWSAVSVALPTWWMLVERKPWMMVLGLTGWVAIGFMCVLIAITSYTSDPSAPVVMMLGIGVYAAILCGGLQLARQLGYRLVNRLPHTNATHSTESELSFDAIPDE